jgi:hypothetical protein
VISRRNLDICFFLFLSISFLALLSGRVASLSMAKSERQRNDSSLGRLAEISSGPLFFVTS